MEAAAALLAPLSEEEERSYFDALMAKAPGLTVRRSGARGRCLFALRDFEEGEEVLREAPLLAIQHEHNKRDALACACCFRFLGSVELQIARRLLRRAAAPGAAAASLPDVAPAQAGFAAHAAPEAAVEETEEEGEAAETEEGPPVDAEALRLAALLDGSASLPHSAAFPLPPPLSCEGGCEARFCGASCAQRAWEDHHRLLCPGARGEAGDRTQLRSFWAHCRRSNDIFGLAAQVLASTALRARAELGGSWEGAEGAEPQARQDALLRAWRPFAAAHRRPWSDCVSLPADVAAGGDAAAASFRLQLRRLAAASLRRLAAALPRQAALFPTLFSPAVFEQVVGMFELNNLDVVVESPVENYFLLVDDLPADSAARSDALVVTQPLLDALDSGYATALDGTGFFSCVACANHDCDPTTASSKGAADVDGSAVLVATRDILAGEEVTVCYIDAPPGTPLAARREALRDYGFHCDCARCLREEAGEGRRGRKSK